MGIVFMYEPVDHELSEALASVDFYVEGQRFPDVESIVSEWAGGMLGAAHERVLSMRDRDRIRAAGESIRVEVKQPSSILDGLKRGSWRAYDLSESCERRAVEMGKSPFIDAHDAQMELMKLGRMNYANTYVANHRDEYAQHLAQLIEVRPQALLRAIHRACEWGDSTALDLENLFGELFDRDVLAYKSAQEYDRTLDEIEDWQP